MLNIMAIQTRNICVYDLPLNANLNASPLPQANQWEIEIHPTMTFSELVRIVHTLRQQLSDIDVSNLSDTDLSFYGTHLHEPLNHDTDLPRDIAGSHFVSCGNPRATPENAISADMPLWSRVEQFSSWILLFS